MPSRPPTTNGRPREPPAALRDVLVVAQGVAQDGHWPIRPHRAHNPSTGGDVRYFDEVITTDGWTAVEIPHYTPETTVTEPTGTATTTGGIKLHMPSVEGLGEAVSAAVRAATGMSITNESAWREAYTRNKRLVHTAQDGREVWTDGQTLHVIRPGARSRDDVMRRPILALAPDDLRTDAADYLALADAYPAASKNFTLAAGLLSTVDRNLRSRGENLTEILADLIDRGLVAVPETAKDSR